MSFNVTSVEGLPLAFLTKGHALTYCHAKGIDVSTIAENDTSQGTADLKASLQAQIDSLANLIYSKFVGSPGMLKEYQDASDSAAEWLLDMTKTVPAGVTSWAVPNGWTNQQAAVDIANTTANLTGLMALIRRVRLAGKTSIANAATVSAAQLAYAKCSGSLTAIAGSLK